MRLQTLALATMTLLAAPVALAQSELPGQKPDPNAPSATAELPGQKPNPDGPDAAAEPPPEEKKPMAFGGADLMVGRHMKQPMGDKVFTVGIDVGVAPLDIGLSVTRDALVDQAISSACGADAACRSQADAAIKSIGTLSAGQWETIKTAAGTSGAELTNQLIQAGVPAAQAQQLGAAVDSNSDPAQRQQVVNLIRRTESGANALFDPFVDVNLKWIALKASVPFTIAVLGGSAKAYMANIGLEAKSGYAWEFGLIGVGITGGLSMYFPSGMEGASAAAMADLFSSPKYAFGYLTIAPYLVAGVDFTWVTLQAHLEIDSMHRVRDSFAPDSIQFLRWGTGLVILPRLHPKWTISIIGEINGLAPINNADPYDAIFAVAGLQLRLYLLKLAVAAQMPIVKETEALGQIAGIDVGSLAGYYILTRLAFVF
jgi:hypothetical protein